MKKENYIEKNFRKIWIKPALIVGKAKKTEEGEYPTNGDDFGTGS